MYQKPEDIAFSKDIAEAVALKLGISKSSALKHIDFFVHWVKKLTEDPDIVNISLPSIGSLYVNWTMMKNRVELLKSKEEDITEFDKKRISLFESKIKKLEKEFEDNNGHNRHKRRFKFTSTYYNKGMSIEEMENWQNKQ